MATEIKMPQLGESVVEGTITKWLKKEGERVEEDELLVEVSTDKVDSEIPSSASGTIQRILVSEGDTVTVGMPIAVVGEEAEASAPRDAAPTLDDGAERSAEDKEEAAAAVPTPAPDAASKAALERERAEEPESRPGVGKVEDHSAQPEPREQATRSGQAEPQEERGAEVDRPGPPAPPSEGRRPPARRGDTSKRGIISPLVRRLAEEQGVNLDEIEGTGTGGRIRKQDVLRFVEKGSRREPAREAPAEERAAAAPEARPEPATRAQEREQLVPWSNIRRRTAEHMVSAHLETARAWNAMEVDWSKVVALRARFKDAFKRREGFNLTYMPFLARALCETLLEMPEVNASFDEANEANRLRHYVNLGIAVALEGGGLIVPVVKGADEKNLVGVARAINDVVTRARSKKLVPDDLAGGTCTITNPGPFGSILSVPIIPRGQAAIVGFEAIQKRVVVTDDDAIAIRSMGFLSMSWDHRIIDGAEAARFLARLRERLETTDFSSELSQYT